MTGQTGADAVGVLAMRSAHYRPVERPVLRQVLTLAAPLVVIVTGSAAAHFFTALLGRWAWAGTVLVYWGLLIGIIVAFDGRERVAVWFSAWHGSRWWLVLALAVGLLSFPLMLVPHLGVLASIPLTALWLLFAPVNATCEELFWRGFLLDGTAWMPLWVGVSYSSIAFVAIHPMMLGVFSRANRLDLAAPAQFLPFAAIVLFLGLVFSLLYLRTGSLRLPILSHALSDLGILSIFVFMSMVAIPGT